MSVPLRGDPGDDFREGTVENFSRDLDIDLDPAPDVILVSEEDFVVAEIKRSGDLFDRPLAAKIREKYEDKVVAINKVTGEEIAIADDTHQLAKMLSELEYNKEAALIVRCDEHSKRSYSNQRKKIHRPSPRTRSKNR